MKRALFIICFWATMPVANAQSTPKSTIQKQSGIQKIIIQEVLQTSNYTYLHGKEGDSEKWFAVPSMEAKAGDVYYYKGGLPMTKFESKELKRTFDEVIFLGGVSTDPNLTVRNNTKDANAEPYKRKAAPETKKDIKIEVVKDGLTIAQLLSNKESYAGKTVKIKGQVTKFTPSIMNKNWIHFQDGTDYNGKFDLVITSASEVKVGETISLEGKISLNKDFGYGYLFEVLMEDAIVK